MHPSILISRLARVAAPGLLLACPVWGATTITMRIGGASPFPILEYDNQVQPATHGTAPGRGAAQAYVRAITVIKQRGTESPMLYEAAASGRHLPEVVIEFYRTAPKGDPQLYLMIKLIGVVVTNVREVAGHGGSFSQAQTVEEITLAAAKIQKTYIPEKAEEDPVERPQPNRVQHN